METEAGSPVVPSEEDEREGGAAAAFRRFSEIAATPAGLSAADPDELLRLLVPFLRNPRYAPHVGLIGQALAQRDFVRLYTRGPMRLVGTRVLRRVWPKYLERLRQREEELLATLELAELHLDLLPAKVADAPPEWRAAGKRAFLIEGRVDVDPARGLVPTSLAIRIDLHGEGFRMTDSFPTSEVAEEGAIVREGQFVARSAHEEATRAGVRAGVAGAGASIRASATDAESQEESRKVTVSQTLVAQRIVNAAVGRSARWTVLRTAEQAPVGGLSFYAIFLDEAGNADVGVTLTATVDFEGWGETKSSLARRLSLPAAVG